MTTFHYKALNKEGAQFEGVIDAKDKFEAYHLIKKEGNTIISAKENKKTFTVNNILSMIPFINSVSTHDKIIFARNLGQMIDAGLPITRGLYIMERQAPVGAFKNLLHDLNDSLGKGNTLSDSMKVYPNIFSSLFTSMVRAGEESGNLSLSLKNIAMQTEKSYQLTRKIRGALMYPLVIVFLMIIIGVLMMIYMVPTLSATFIGMGVALPLSTRIIIGISDFLKNYLPFVILGTPVLIFGGMFVLKTDRGQRVVDYITLHTPIINEIVRQINSARTARTLSSLLSSGVDIVVAIDVVKSVMQNYYYKVVLDEIQVTIQKGDQISSVFLAHENLYPLFVGEMVSVGEETGKIGDMLLSVAIFYEEEVDQKTKDMSSVIEPFLMIFIGLIVGFFAIAMISPIYSVGDYIK